MGGGMEGYGTQVVTLQPPQMPAVLSHPPPTLPQGPWGALWVLQTLQSSSPPPSLLPAPQQRLLQTPTSRTCWGGGAASHPLLISSTPTLQRDMSRPYKGM